MNSRGIANRFSIVQNFEEITANNHRWTRTADCECRNFKRQHYPERPVLSGSGRCGMAGLVDEIGLVDEMKPGGFKPVGHKISFVIHS